MSITLIPKWTLFDNENLKGRFLLADTGQVLLGSQIINSDGTIGERYLGLKIKDGSCYAINSNERYAEVVKLSPDGAVEWSSTLRVNQSITDTKLDGLGNLYILYDASKLVRFDQYGNTLYFPAPSNGDDWTGEIEIAQDGSVYVTGSLFDDGSIDDLDDIASGTKSYSNSWDAYLRKYSNDGNHIWTRLIDFSSIYRKRSTDNGYALDVDSLGNIYITGQGHEWNKGGAFLNKYDAEGNLVWSRRNTGIPTLASGWGLSIDSNDNIFLLAESAGIVWVETWNTSGQLVSSYPAKDTKSYVETYDFIATEDGTLYIYGRKRANEDIDAMSLFVEQIAIRHAPSEISLSDYRVSEDLKPGSTIGYISVDDQDPNESFLFEVSDSAPSHEWLSVEGNQLLLNEEIDYEQLRSFAIQVKATDSDGLALTRNFTINVIDTFDEVPSDILLTNGAVNENISAGTVVSNLKAVDADSGDVHTFELVNGEGDSDNSHFKLIGNQLILIDQPDYEEKSEYNLRIKTVDKSGLTVSVPLKLQVNDLNEAPASISISSLSFLENIEPGSVVATIDSFDPDLREPYIYLTRGYADGAHNGAFELKNNQLIIKQSPDYEKQSEYAIFVKSLDNGGLYLTQQFKLNVIDQNDKPHGIKLSNYDVDENLPTGSIVASIIVLDQDIQDSHELSFEPLPDGDDNSSFQIDGFNLRLLPSPDYETKNIYTIGLKAVDSEGLATVEEIQMQVMDLDDTVRIISTVSEFSTDENGGSSQISVRLGSMPSDIVKLKISASDLSEAYIDIDSLEFDSINWNVPRLVTVSGVDDYEDDGDQEYWITFSTETTDPDYASLQFEPIVLQNLDDGEDIGEDIYGDLGTIPTKDNLNGTEGPDAIYGLLSEDILYGGPGNDLLFGGYGNDIIYGEEGDDELYGEQQDDTLYGGEGNDRLTGGEGKDLLIGGPGNDIYVVDDERDTIDDQGLPTDIDTVLFRANLNAYTLPASIKNGVLESGSAFKLIGNALDNNLKGNDNNNDIDGGDGNDILNGGGGNDTLKGGSGSDTAHYAPILSGFTFDPQGGASITANLLTGVASGLEIGTDTLIGIENIETSDGSDTLIGNHFANRLVGNGGNDNLQGNDGDDILQGGQGDDVIDGGLGNDQAIYSGIRENYTVTNDSATSKVTIKDQREFHDGTDIITGIESFMFADITLTLSELIGDSTLTTKSTMDFTGDGEVDETDALLMMRHMMGTFPGDAITQGIPGITDINGLRDKIMKTMEESSAFGGGRPLDIDGDGLINPFSDGMMILKHIHGKRQEASGGLPEMPDFIKNPMRDMDQMQTHLKNLIGF